MADGEPQPPSLGGLTRVFGRIGLLSFGGPAAQIALMHRELVETRKWLSEDAFLKALSFCMLLPGPEAMQLATYAGWRQRGIIGGLIGGGLFILPGALVIGLLALLYLHYGTLPLVQAMFLGVKAVVIVIVIRALVTLVRRAVHGVQQGIVALAAFLALFLFSVPFPLVVAAAALAGALLQPKAQAMQAPTPQSWRQSLWILLIGITLWLAPLAWLAVTGNPFLTELGQFFATLAIVTFGGAYAVLAYMTQEVVVTLGWLTTDQMIDALGLAETTPGPLILVTQFVGMLAGAYQGGTALALLAGAVTLWVTFVPCFFWIFAGAPLIDWLDSWPRLRAALQSVTAAVVGVIANLSLWFALHVFFGAVDEISFGPISTVHPEFATIDLTAIGLAGVAAILLLWRNWPLAPVLAICAGLSGLVSLL